MFVATIVATDALGQGDISAAWDRLADAGCAPNAAHVIEVGKAVDLPFAQDPKEARATLAALSGTIDSIVQRASNRQKKLLIADMDSTMITVECIDELADYAGIKAQIAAVTEAAMRGELDFAEALRARVALLAGMDETLIDQCRAERVKIMPGAKALVQTMRARGAQTVLVSGGFTRFAEPVAAEIGFARVVANVLDIANGQLTGTVAQPIVDALRKRQELERACAAFGIDPADAMAVGDGANDIPMIEAAGLGVAYHAKEKARTAADAEIRHGDLSVLLYAQGIKRTDWVEG
ncbi:MAG: phosphoserine phosphatase SerB [Sphingobium sp.]